MANNEILIYSFTACLVVCTNLVSQYNEHLHLSRHHHIRVKLYECLNIASVDVQSIRDRYSHRQILMYPCLGQAYGETIIN